MSPAAPPGRRDDRRPGSAGGRPPPPAGLDIPRMRALHGTANALGFALAGVLAWVLAERGRGPDPP